MWSRIKWALRSSDPTARTAMWIAFWSAVIGLLGFGLGVIGAIPILKGLVSLAQRAGSHLNGIW
jgi:hypothetical protein